MLWPGGVWRVGGGWPGPLGLWPGNRPQFPAWLSRRPAACALRATCGEAVSGGFGHVGVGRCCEPQHGIWAAALCLGCWGTELQEVPGQLGQESLQMKGWASGCLRVWSGKGSARCPVTLWAAGLAVEAVEDLGFRWPSRHPPLGSHPSARPRCRALLELGWAPAGAQVAFRSQGPRLEEQPYPRPWLSDFDCKLPSGIHFTPRPLPQTGLLI